MVNYPDMYQIPELENLTSFRPAIDHEHPLLAPDKLLQRSDLHHVDLHFIQRRERIDSEDFTFISAVNTKRELEFFQYDSPNNHQHSDEHKARRKPSLIPNIDPNLLQLEVALLALHFQSLKSARQRSQAKPEARFQKVLQTNRACRGIVSDQLSGPQSPYRKRVKGTSEKSS